MAWSTIKVQLKSVVEGTGLFATTKVLNYPVKSETYPFKSSPNAIIVSTGLENERLTTDDNYREWEFVIIVMRHVANGKLETEWPLLETDIETIIDAIDANPMLNDSVCTTIPVSARMGIVNDQPDQMVIAGTLVVKCKKDKSIS